MDSFYTLITSRPQMIRKQQLCFSIQSKTNFQRYPKLSKNFSHVANLSIVPLATHPQNNPSSTPMSFTRTSHLVLATINLFRSNVMSYLLCITIYSRLVLVHWGQIMILSSVLQQTLSSACLYREYFSFTHLLTSYLTHTLWSFLTDQCVTQVLISRSSVEGSGSKAKRFRRFLELTQEVFWLHLCLRIYLISFSFCVLMIVFKLFLVSGLIPDPEFSPPTVRSWM